LTLNGKSRKEGQGRWQPKSLAITLRFFSGAAFCSMIVPTIEVKAIRAKITTASVIAAKKSQIVSIIDLVLFSSTKISSASHRPNFYSYIIKFFG